MKLLLTSGGITNAIRVVDGRTDVISEGTWRLLGARPS
jgi:hypothetical protein